MANWPYNTTDWKRLRKAKLQRDPLCQYQHQGCTMMATQVDHRTPIKAGGDPWHWDNLASACASCHSRKTVHEDGGFNRKPGGSVPIKGCDADGRPLAPDHWWNDSRYSTNE